MTRYLAVLVPVLLFAGCGTKTATTTVRLTEMHTTTVVKRIAAPPAAVFVADRKGDLVYKPTVIDLSDSAAITDIHWTSYGRTLAIGRGRYPLNACEPSCAEAKLDWVGVTVSLRSRSLCRGRLAYRLMALDGPGFKVTFEAVPTVINATRRAC